MSPAKRSPALGEEALSLKIAVTNRTFETIGVIVLVQRLNPSITGGNWESTSNAFSGEEIIPIFFTIWIAIFQIK